MSKETSKTFGYDAIHAGFNGDPGSAGVIPAISLATTFYQKTPGQGQYEYSRSGNPVRDIFEANVAKLEGGKHGFGFSSGLAATTAFVELLKPGEKLICLDDVYGGTQRLFKRTLRAPVETELVDLSNLANLDKYAGDSAYKWIWIETPSNPTLKVTDIAAVCEKAKEMGMKVAVDNTFATPYNQQPLALGADVVIHSVSKYLNGHSDVIMGAVVCNDQEIADRIKYVQNAMGSVPSPFDCWLVVRGLKTLHVRMQRHNENAAKAAAYLEAHPKVEKVHYPGLESFPQHEIAKKQMSGYGGMVSIWVKGGVEEASKFLQSLKVFALAESLGGVESLAEHPALMTHGSVPAEERAVLGIMDNFIRLSVGIEESDLIIDDLKNALEQI